MNHKNNFIFTIIILFLTIPAFSKWSEPVPVTVTNDPSAEAWSPFLTTDGLTFYFVKVRSSSSFYGKICAATRNDIDEPFTSAQVLDCPLNRSPGHQLCPWVSCDNLRMYYHNENGNWRIMLSERNSISEPWPAGKGINELNILGNKLQAPVLTEGELIIIFNALDISGGKGKCDLWMATRPDRHSEFSYYRNLSEINTEFDEFASFITPDGLVLYFSSNRNGNTQLFKASRNKIEEEFSLVQPLPEFAIPSIIYAQPCLSYNGHEMYFMMSNESDRSTRNIYVSYYSEGNSFLLNRPNTETLYEIIENTNQNQ